MAQLTATALVFEMSVPDTTYSAELEYSERQIPGGNRHIVDVSGGKATRLKTKIIVQTFAAWLALLGRLGKPDILSYEEATFPVLLVSATRSMDQAGCADGQQSVDVEFIIG